MWSACALPGAARAQAGAAAACRACAAAAGAALLSWLAGPTLTLT